MSHLTSYEQLESKFGTPNALVSAKTINHLDAGALSWITASTIMIASVGQGHEIDVVCAGGPPGWAGGDKMMLRLPTSALDAPQQLVPGSGFGSIFMVASLNELLRVNGRIASNDGIEVEVSVEECFLHCGKALIRSDFWSGETDGADHGSLQYTAGRCRFMALATYDPQSGADLSPKGDPAGLMVHLGQDTLRFADRPGNRRIDSFRNIIDQPSVAAALLVPGSRNLVVVRGRARITDDLTERERFTVLEKIPELVTVIEDIRIDQRESRALAAATAWPTPAAPAGVNVGKIGAGHLKLGKGVGAKLAGIAMSVPGLAKSAMAKDYKTNLY